MTGTCTSTTLTSRQHHDFSTAMLQQLELMRMGAIGPWTLRLTTSVHMYNDCSQAFQLSTQHHTRVTPPPQHQHHQHRPLQHQPPMPHASPHKPPAALAPRPGLRHPFLWAPARPSPLLPLLLALLSAALLPRGAWASFSCYSCTSCGFTYCNSCRSTSFSGSTCSVSCLVGIILVIITDVGTLRWDQDPFLLLFSKARSCCAIC